ncbi:MAG: hypothetical protein Q9164_006836 [Protoblastenia rupestris]
MEHMLVLSGYSPNISLERADRYEYQLSLVYLNTSNAVQQTVYNGGHWNSSLVWPASLPPSENTKLSLSTSYAEPMRLLPQYPPTTPPNLTMPLGKIIYTFGFYSVVTYQSNRSLITIDLHPSANDVLGPRTNQNELSKYYTSSGEIFEPAYTDIGFACDYRNTPGEIYKTPITICYTGDMDSGPDANYHDIQASFWDPITILAENDTLLSGPLKIEAKESYTSKTTRLNRNVELTMMIVYGPAEAGTDIPMVMLANNITAFAFLSTDYKVILVFVKPGDPYLDTRGASCMQPVNSYGNCPSTGYESLALTPIAIPFPHFSIASSSLSTNSTIVDLYYQENDTTLAEISYDMAEKEWSQETVFISLV